MNYDEFTVEVQSGRDYVVRAQTLTGKKIELRVRVSPTVLGLLDVPAEAEARVVAAGAEFATSRYPAVDLPAFVDLDILAAEHDDFVAAMRARLTEVSQHADGTDVDDA